MSKDDYGEWEKRLNRGSGTVSIPQQKTEKHPCAFCHDCVYTHDKHIEDYGLQFCRISCRDHFGKSHGLSIEGWGKTIEHSPEMTEQAFEEDTT